MDDDEKSTEIIDWYTGEFNYSGFGRAIFEEPSGYVEGPVKLEITDLGKIEAELEIHAVVTERPLPLGVMQLLNRGPVVQEDDSAISMSITEDTVSNRCLRFQFFSPEGSFISERIYSIAHTTNWLAGGPETETLKLRMSGGYFVASSARKDVSPRFWVMPLTNLIAHFPNGSQGFADHPLLIRRARIPPSHLNSDETGMFQMNAHLSQRLIKFSFGEHSGFIEPLPDYGEIVKRLTGRVQQRAVTAVMIGEIPEEIDSYVELEKLLPRDIQVVLGVATGSEVGTPWIEIRDQSGGLISRIHKGRGNPAFAKGHSAVADVGNSGVGQLLTSAFLCSNFDSAKFRFLGTSLTRAGLSSLVVEERLSILFRAFDSLCKSLSLDNSGSIDDLLDEQHRLELQKILKQAFSQIQGMSAQMQSDGNLDAAIGLSRVAESVFHAKTLNQGLGKAIRLLIAHYGFSDLAVVDAYMLENEPAGRKRWEHLIGYCRGVVMHDGFIDSSAHPSLSEAAGALLDHLHDLLLRIFLTMADYQGTYQPTAATLHGTWALDWVSPTTPPRRLGYW